MAEALAKKYGEPKALRIEKMPTMTKYPCQICGADENFVSINGAIYCYECFKKLEIERTKDGTEDVAK